MSEIERLLESRIAERAGVPEEGVRDVFATYGLPLVATPSRPRSLRLHRLRVSGVRTGSVAPGPFDSTMRFSDGMTALVASNFRGKTSVLELVTWCLRGTPRELQSGVRNWLSTLDLDVVVAGQAMGFRLDIAEGEIVSAVVLTAMDVTQLQSLREADPARDVSPLIRAASSASYAEQVQALMLGRLDLQPLVNSYKGTATQTHGWPAYYGAIYLPAGGDKALLGDLTMAGLPGRLLQVFLDLPATAALTRVKTALDVRVNENKARAATAAAIAGELDSQRVKLQSDLTQARARLEALDKESAMEESLSGLAERAVALAGRVVDAQETRNELVQAHRLARSQRQQDTKMLNDVTESATARRLFHGLDPRACPRCDQAIEEERRLRESATHACAVCARPVEGDDETPEDVITEAKTRLSASEAAEQAAWDTLGPAEEDLARVTEELAAVQERLRRAQTASQLPRGWQPRKQCCGSKGARLPSETPADRRCPCRNGGGGHPGRRRQDPGGRQQGRSGRPLRRTQRGDRRARPSLRHRVAGVRGDRPLRTAEGHQGRRHRGPLRETERGRAPASSHRGGHRAPARRRGARRVHTPRPPPNRQPQGRGGPRPGRTHPSEGTVAARGRQ